MVSGLYLFLSEVPRVLRALNLKRIVVSRRDFTCYIENMTDQSHVAWAHHGAAGNRCARNLLPSHMHIALPVNRNTVCCLFDASAIDLQVRRGGRRLNLSSVLMFICTLSDRAAGR